MITLAYIIIKAYTKKYKIFTKIIEKQIESVPKYNFLSVIMVRNTFKIVLVIFGFLFLKVFCRKKLLS